MLASGADVAPFFVLSPAHIIEVDKLVVADRGVGSHSVATQPTARDASRKLPEPTTGVGCPTIVFYGFPRCIHRLARNPSVRDWDRYPLFFRPNRISAPLLVCAPVRSL